MSMVPTYFSTASGTSGITGFGPQGISGKQGFACSTGVSGSSGTAGFPADSEYWIKELNGTHPMNGKYSTSEKIINGEKYLVHISPSSPPAQIITDLNGIIQSVNDEPAVIYSIGSISSVHYWFKDNKLHRENGPAIDVTNVPNGTKMYFLDDFEITEERLRNYNRYNRLKDILQN